jgi:dTDP-4-dehydrorhamnose 3,5-epimerase
MIFEETALSGAFIVRIDPRADHRGMFARTFCSTEFAAHGLPGVFVQCNVSYNCQRGVLRGMHFQRDPKPEGKLVRCTRGAAHDVIIDLRRESPTHCRWIAVELTSNNHTAIYVPPGFAHGFQVLADGTEMFYQMTTAYVSDLADGVRWNDPAFAISWPVSEPILSPRDESYPDYDR